MLRFLYLDRKNHFLIYHVLKFIYFIYQNFKNNHYFLLNLINYKHDHKNSNIPKIVSFYIYESYFMQI